MEVIDDKVTSCDGQTARSQDEGFLTQTVGVHQRKLPRGDCTYGKKICTLEILLSAVGSER